MNATIDTLILAQQTYTANHILSRKDKKLNAKILFDKGWPVGAISQVTGLSITLVKRAVGYDPNILGGARYMFDKFNPDTLDALIYIATSFYVDGLVPYKLVRRVVAWGTGLHMVSFLTGISANDLVVHE